MAKNCLQEINGSGSCHSKISTGDRTLSAGQAWRRGCRLLRENRPQVTTSPQIIRQMDQDGRHYRWFQPVLGDDEEEKSCDFKPAKFKRGGSEKCAQKKY